MSEIAFGKAVPVLRIFDLDRAKAFYCGWLGFSVDWEAPLPEGGPTYLQVSRGPLLLHLSSHHGDGTPGSVVYVRMAGGLRELHAELLAKAYPFNRPGIDAVPWGGHEMHCTDPFANTIRFHQP
jgi:catechol 2,3-dioxygenase-like lactoylglutathione lyase family enzyme